MENLFAEQTTVKISVVKIENKRLTKSIVNQLIVNSPFDKLFVLKENVKFLGYVNDKKEWIIWTANEFLYKYEFRNIWRIARIDLDRDKIKDLIEIYPSELVKSLYHSEEEYVGHIYRDAQISSVLDLKEQYKILDRKEEVQKIANEIWKRQIII